MNRLLAAADLGAQTWQQVWDGLITPREALASLLARDLDHRGYAAWRKGYEEARERTIREYPM